jgi:hypothetical protein
VYAAQLITTAGLCDAQKLSMDSFDDKSSNALSANKKSYAAANDGASNSSSEPNCPFFPVTTISGLDMNKYF